jgi:hypothetical protein
VRGPWNCGMRGSVAVGATVVSTVGMSSSDRSLYVFRYRCIGCINRWDVLINYSQDIIWIMIRGEIMVNNNLNINLSSMVPLNSINHKSNQHRESFP